MYPLEPSTADHVGTGDNPGCRYHNLGLRIHRGATVKADRLINSTGQLFLNLRTENWGKAQSSRFSSPGKSVLVRMKSLQISRGRIVRTWPVVGPVCDRSVVLSGTAITMLIAHL